MQQSVAEAVQRFTTPEDTILLIGRMPNSVYIHSGRHAGSRYFHYTPLWKEKLFQSTEETHIEQFSQDLKERNPALLLFDLTRMPPDEPLQRVQEFTPAILPYFQEHYAPLEEVFDLDPIELWFWYDIRLVIWARKDLAERHLP